MSKEYKIVSYRDWERNYRSTYPNARVNGNRTEVLISCLRGEGTMTLKEVRSHINDYWPDVGG